MIPFVAQMAASTIIDKVFDKSAPKGGAGSEFRKYDQLDRQIGGDREDVTIEIEGSQIPTDQIKNSLGREVVTKETSMKSLYDSISNDNKKIIDALESSEQRINKNLENIAKGIEKVNKNVQKSATVSELYGKMGLQGAGRVGFGGNEKDGLTSAAGRIGELGAMILGGLGAIMGVLGLGNLVGKFGSNVADWWDSLFDPNKTVIKELENIKRSVDKRLESSTNNELANSGGGHGVEANYLADVTKDTADAGIALALKSKAERQGAKAIYKPSLTARKSNIKVLNKNILDLENKIDQYSIQNPVPSGAYKTTINGKQQIDVESTAYKNWLSIRNETLSEDIRQLESYKKQIKLQEIGDELYKEIYNQIDSILRKSDFQTNIDIRMYSLAILITQDPRYFRGLEQAINPFTSKVAMNSQTSVAKSLYDDLVTLGIFNEDKSINFDKLFDDRGPTETFFSLVPKLIECSGLKISKNIFSNGHLDLSTLSNNSFDNYLIAAYRIIYKDLKEQFSDYINSYVATYIARKNSKLNQKNFEYEQSLSDLGLLAHTGVSDYFDAGSITDTDKERAVEDFLSRASEEQVSEFLKEHKLKVDPNDPNYWKPIWKELEKINDKATKQIGESEGFQNYSKRVGGNTLRKGVVLNSYIKDVLSGSVEQGEIDPDLVNSVMGRWGKLYYGDTPENQSKINALSNNSSTDKASLNLFKFFNPKFRIKLGDQDLKVDISENGDISITGETEEGPKAIISQDGSTSVTTP